MRILHLFVWALALCFLTSLDVRADDPPPKLSADARAALVAGLKWKTGAVTLKNGLAKLNLTDNFRFLEADDARKVLHDLWGNPDDPDVLGMIFPRDKGPHDDDNWAVTISYEENGYVKDDDAATIKYDDLLKELQKQVVDSNPQLVKEGYPSRQLVGWAAEPRYDKATHKLYWAKDFKFEGESEDSLNYDIRILGRRGVLVLTALASMSQFSEIDKQVPGILAMVDFQPGNTYAEFDPKMDKVAEYGLTALIAGGALAGAAKLGLFALLAKYSLAAILLLKKFLIYIIVVIVAGAKKVWASITGKKNKTPDRLLPPQGPPSPPPGV
jgi:uncharacterized membrane-anchored protein